MSTTIHRASTRGLTEEDWLTSHHSFAFNFWYDPARTGFGALRVLNEDVIAPHRGFGTHGHRDMEIVTIVLSGELTHKDSSGGSGVIRPGEVQRMSAGRGVFHSEKNDSAEPVHLLQVWVTPKEKGIAPSYEQERFRITKNSLTTVVDGTQGRKVAGALYMHQHAKFSLGEFDAREIIAYNTTAGHGTYLFIISGEVSIGGERLSRGDAAAITGLSWEAEATAAAKVLVIEVPTA